MDVQLTHTQTRVFERRSVMRTTLEQMMAFHADPKALSVLTPPPIFVQVRSDKRTSLTEGDIDFTLWMAFIPLHWIARHESGPTPNSFADKMILGPMQGWRHEHLFSAVEGGVELLDRITLSHKRGWRGVFTRLIFDGLALHILFLYRHIRTRRIVEK